MGKVTPILDRHARPMRDGLVNALTGAGTTSDASNYRGYSLRKLTPDQIDASYRSSWLMRKAIDLPPFDMTRAWRDWQAEEDQIEALEVEERRIDLKSKLRRALILGRLGGGAIIIGAQQGAPDQPLAVERLGKGVLSYIHVLSRYQIQPDASGFDMDPASPTFGQPKMWVLSSAGNMARIHPSRVIAFRGQPGADLLAQSGIDQFWGDSVCQTVMDAIKNADEAQAGFAALIKEAKLDIIGIPNLTQNFATAEYEQLLTRRLAAAQLAKSIHNALITDAGNGEGSPGESWEQRQVSWGGMPEVIQTYLSIVAGAADIPATRLLGKAPDGMNATGESDQDNYLQMIAARQDADLAPALSILDEVLIRSALGSRDPNIHYVFAPLRVLSDVETATLNKTKADTVAVYVDTGLLPTEAMERAVQNMLVEDGWLPGFDGALAEMPEDERFPSLETPDPANDPEAEGGDPDLAAGDAPRRVAANDARKRWPAAEE